MELERVIQERRSIRKFKGNKLEQSDLEDIIAKAIWAPTGSNMQAWEFIIIDEVEHLSKLKLFSPGLIGDPAAAIVVCINKSLAKSKAGKLGENALAYYDAGIIGYNISLLAWDKKIGTCLIASFNKNAVKHILHIPDSVEPHLIVTLGIPASIPKPPKRKELVDVLHYQLYKEEKPNG